MEHGEQNTDGRGNAQFSFEFNGGVVFITNIKFDNVKSKKLQDHLQALQSRCHYLDLTIDSMRDRMLRIRQICGQGMLEKYSHAPGDTGGPDPVHIREQAQVEGDLIEDGSQDSGSLEDEAGGIQAVGGIHLHEAWSIMPLDPEVQKELEWMTDKEIHDLGGRVWMGIGAFVLFIVVLGLMGSYLS